MNRAMKIILSALMAGMLSATSAQAAEDAISQDRIDAALKLQEDLKMGETYNKALMERVDEMASQRPELEKVKEKIKKYMIENMGWKTIKDDRARIYAKHFTVEELKVFGDFFKSEAGQKILKTLPQLDREEGILIQQKVKNMLPGMTKILQEAVESGNSADGGENNSSDQAEKQE